MTQQGWVIEAKGLSAFPEKGGHFYLANPVADSPDRFDDLVISRIGFDAVAKLNDVLVECLRFGELVHTPAPVEDLVARNGLTGVFSDVGFVDLVGLEGLLRSDLLSIGVVSMFISTIWRNRRRTRKLLIPLNSGMQEIGKPVNSPVAQRGAGPAFGRLYALTHSMVFNLIAKLGY